MAARALGSERRPSLLSRAFRSPSSIIYSCLLLSERGTTRRQPFNRKDHQANVIKSLHTLAVWRTWFCLELCPWSFDHLLCQGWPPQYQLNWNLFLSWLEEASRLALTHSSFLRLSSLRLSSLHLSSLRLFFHHWSRGEFLSWVSKDGEQTFITQ